MYILGELHFFIEPVSNHIDHKLGFDIYEMSSSVWTEVQQTKPIVVPESRKLSVQLTVENWNNIVKIFKDIINSNGRKTDSQKEILLEKFLSDLNGNDPVTAYANLGTLSFLEMQKKRPLPNVHKGLISVLTEIEKNSEIKKIIPIESTTSVGDAWWNNCNKDQANILITEGLKKLDPSYSYENEITFEVQNIFLKRNSELNDIVEAYKKIEEGGTLFECAIISRNKEWLPTLKKILSTSGEPVSLIVGIGHLAGNDGLLAMLKAEGYTDIKRVYEISR